MEAVAAPRLPRWILQHDLLLKNALEVLLGRATDDVNVEIDLTREGRANKVSRSQITGMRFIFETNRHFNRQYVFKYCFEEVVEFHPDDNL